MRAQTVAMYRTVRGDGIGAQLVDALSVTRMAFGLLGVPFSYLTSENRGASIGLEGSCNLLFLLPSFLLAMSGSKKLEFIGDRALIISLSESLRVLLPDECRLR